MQINWLKFVIVGSAASVAVGSAQFVQTDAVDIVTLVTAVLTALLAFLTDSRK